MEPLPTRLECPKCRNDLFPAWRLQFCTGVTCGNGPAVADFVLLRNAFRSLHEFTRLPHFAREEFHGQVYRALETRVNVRGAAETKADQPEHLHANCTNCGFVMGPFLCADAVPS